MSLADVAPRVGIHDLVNSELAGGVACPRNVPTSKQATAVAAPPVSTPGCEVESATSRRRLDAASLRESAGARECSASNPRTFRAIDGTAITASGFSSIDIAGLAAVTGGRDITFAIGTGISSSRRAGGAKSTEILIELTGIDAANAPLRSRHAVFHPGGAAPLTAIGVSMLIERLTGLDGNPATKPGLYFPYQVLDHAAYLARLEQDGGKLMTLPLA